MGSLTTAQVAEKFLPILRQHLEFVDGAADIPMDKSLEELGLNSFGVILLLLELEEVFGVTFPDSMLTPEAFRTATTLLAAIVDLVNHHDGGAAQ